MWIFHVDDSQKNSRYDTIICQDLLLELKLDLRFSNYKIKGNGGTYKGCTAPMKDPSDFCDNERFRNEEWWEREHILDSTRRTHRILDANYQRYNSSIIVSNSKHLNENEILYNRYVRTREGETPSDAVSRFACPPDKTNSGAPSRAQQVGPSCGSAIGSRRSQSHIPFAPTRNLYVVCMDR